jgi:hypothetical protein
MSATGLFKRKGARTGMCEEVCVWDENPHTNTHTMRSRGFGWRIHFGVEVTEVSNNKQTQSIDDCSFCLRG